MGSFNVANVLSRKMRLVAVLLCITSIAAVLFMPTGLGALIASLILIYPCARYIPRDISWMPCVVFALVIAFVSEGYIFPGFPRDMDTLKLVSRFFISVFLILICLCVYFLPKRISWLPCLILLVMLGGGLEGLDGEKMAYLHGKNNDAVKAIAPETPGALQGSQKK